MEERWTVDEILAALAELTIAAQIVFAGQRDELARQLLYVEPILTIFFDDDL